MPKNYRVYAKTLEECEQRCLDEYYDSEGGHIENQRYLACLQECRKDYSTSSPNPNSTQPKGTPTSPPPYTPDITTNDQKNYTKLDRPNPAETPVTTLPTSSKAKQTYDLCEKTMKKIVGDDENLYNPLCSSIAIGFEALMDGLIFVGNLLKNYTIL